jgi:hypothetical protein
MSRERGLDKTRLQIHKTHVRAAGTTGDSLCLGSDTMRLLLGHCQTHLVS